MESHRDCCLGLCNTAEPEINCQDLFSEHFAHLLPSPHIAYFYLKPIFISFPFSFPFHISLPFPTLYSVILSSPHYVCHVALHYFYQSTVSLIFLSSFFLLCELNLLFLFHQSLLASSSYLFFLHYSFPLCAPVFYLSLSHVSHIFILGLSLAPHFLFSSAALLYLCSLAVVPVGCSYLNLTLILLMEMLSKHQRKEGIGE